MSTLKNKSQINQKGSLMRFINSQENEDVDLSKMSQSFDAEVDAQLFLQSDTDSVSPALKK